MHYKYWASRLTVAAASLALLLAVPLAAGAQSAVTVTINGSEVDFSPPPIVQAGRIFVPLRGVFERLGASVVYSQGTINATGNGRNISLQIGSTQATVNGQPQTLDVAPFIVGASTFVPLRFVSESLGATVNWDEANSVASIDLAGVSQSDNSQTYVTPTSDYVTQQAPPPLPDYQQPYVPQPNWIWQPGYWAWGSYGYYWVPGTWVAPPQPGYLWTPGYWSWSGGGFTFNPGYWAFAVVGFYGGVNYGAGYYGNGYVGGRWYGDSFRYNTAVTRVNTTYVTNVYVDKTVIVNNYTTVNRISYNGGPHGLPYRPTPQQLAVRQKTHLPPTPVQRQHVLVASQDRALLASVNHNRPPVVAVARPLSTSVRPAGFVPVTPADRVPAQTHAVPVNHAPPAPVYHAPAPAYHEPVHTAVPYHAPPAPVYHEPVHTAAPYHAPPPAPVYHEPVHTAVPYHAPPPVHTAVPYHAPPPVHTAVPYHAPPPAPVYHAPPVHTAVPVHPQAMKPPPPHPTPHPVETHEGEPK